MYEKLIINLAATGAVHTKNDSRHLPVTPEEIVKDCCRCRELGSSIVHLHARDSEGRPAYQKEIFAEIIRGIRADCPDMIVCVSTSGRTSRS